jgi:hypothetical protein
VVISSRCSPARTFAARGGGQARSSPRIAPRSNVTVSWVVTASSKGAESSTRRIPTSPTWWASSQVTRKIRSGSAERRSRARRSTSTVWAKLAVSSFGLLLEVSRAALVRSEKKLVGAQLSWLDAAARRRPDRAGEVLGVVVVAFAQEAAELQTRAVSLVVRYARHADQAARAGLGQAAVGLPADLRQRAAVALGGRVPEDEPASWPVLLPPTPQELPPPIATPAELAEELAAFWEGYPMVEPLALERLLAALVGFAATDRSALGEALEPVLIRHRIQPRLLDDTHPGPLAYVTNEAQQLIWAILAAITPAAEGRRLRGLLNVISGAGQRRWHGALAASPRPRLAMVYRLHEIAAGLHQPAGPSLVVAAPTAVTGHIDPAELAARLERAAAGGWEPWPYDLEQALLRLPRQPDASAAARARRLDTPAGWRLADWLAGGGLPDPEVTRVVRQIARRDHWPPYLRPCLRARGPGPARPGRSRRCPGDPGRPPPARRSRPGRRAGRDGRPRPAPAGSGDPAIARSRPFRRGRRGLGDPGRRHPQDAPARHGPAPARTPRPDRPRRRGRGHQRPADPGAGRHHRAERLKPAAHPSPPPSAPAALTRLRRCRRPRGVHAPSGDDRFIRGALLRPSGRLVCVTVLR